MAPSLPRRQRRPSRDGQSQCMGAAQIALPAAKMHILASSLLFVRPSWFRPFASASPDMFRHVCMILASPSGAHITTQLATARPLMTGPTFIQLAANCQVVNHPTIRRIHAGLIFRNACHVLKLPDQGRTHPAQVGLNGFESALQAYMSPRL